LFFGWTFAPTDGGFSIAAESLLSVECSETALPLDSLDLAVLVELVKQLIRIFFFEIIIELFLVLSIYQFLVILPDSPLLFGRKILDRGEAPRLVCVILCQIFVRPQFHLKIEARLVRLPEIMPLLNEVVELGRIARVIKVDDARCKVALPGLPPLEHLAEQRWSILGVS
jgi:hypothetical protein